MPASHSLETVFVIQSLCRAGAESHARRMLHNLRTNPCKLGLDYQLKKDSYRSVDYEIT